MVNASVRIVSEYEINDEQGLYLPLHSILRGIGSHSESRTFGLQLHCKLTSEPN